MTQKCSTCNVNLDLDKFKQNLNGSYQKTCIKCLEKTKKYRDENKCLHNKERSKCKICKEDGTGGSSICEHNILRSRCKTCKENGVGGASICKHNINRFCCKICKEDGIGGVSICEHSKRRSLCKECKELGTGGSGICEHNIQRSYCKICSDEKKITIQNMIHSSKKTDKQYNRFDPVNFIDEEFIEELLDKYTHCYYEDCQVGLQIMTRQDDMATIERLDNSVGHIKSNCVICCWKCNCKRKSNLS